MRYSVYTFKKDVLDYIGTDSNHGLNTVKCHLLGHVIEALESLVTIHFLSKSTYEYYNVVVKQAYANTSKWLKTMASETVRNLDSTLKRHIVSDVSKVQKPFSSGC